MILAEIKTSQSSEEGSEITYELNKNPQKNRIDKSLSTESKGGPQKKEKEEES